MYLCAYVTLQIEWLLSNLNHRYVGNFAEQFMPFRVTLLVRLGLVHSLAIETGIVVWRLQCLFGAQNNVWRLQTRLDIYPQEEGQWSNRARSSEPSIFCLLYTSPSPRDGLLSRMPSSAWKKKVCRLLLEKKKFIFFFFFFNDPATTEIYTLHIVGSVRCV